MGDEMKVFQCLTMAFSAIGLLVSATALVISWVNARRTNAVVLQIVDAAGYTHSSESVSESHRFAVWMRNLGLPLRQVTLHLRLVREDGSGSESIEMTRYSIRDDRAIRDHADFSKGMVGKFEIRSEDIVMLGFNAPDVATVRYLDIEAAGYNVQSFRVGGWRGRAVARWNRLARAVNSRFDKIVTTHKGEERSKPGNVLPVLLDVNWWLSYFLRETARRGRVQ